MTQSPALPLDGIRVLDVSQVMAGPFACMMLADLGADVIKVEPLEGDQTRGAMGFKMKGPDSMGFLNMNRNKRSVALDLKTDEGREFFYELAKSADVIVENYRPGVVQRLRIDYDTIRAINPKIVYASISGFGQSGPWSARPGFDLMAQAMSGVMSVTGYKGGKPVKAGVPVADIGCALFAVYGVLSAYIGAQKSGEGQHIDASLFDAAMAFSIWDMSDYWGTGVEPQPLGTSNKMSAPYQAVKARDGYFVMGATNQKLWARLCELLDRPDLFEHPQFETVSLRLKHREALIESLETSFGTRDCEDWIATMLDVGIPAGPILSYPEAFGSEHAQHRGMCMEIDHPNEGKVKNIGFPVKLLGTPQRVRRHPPLLGEHNEELRAELAALRQARAGAEQ
ncbi:CaiB/BaiF CoA transferase family protein [Burkholderia sp. 22PA0099]|uniref:CaiB/BaiF CoA transferase family protein n=1 Tax=Burkholderia sp. 22PA0099 TaxID=3237372 RepID=UPI0039C0AF7A